MRPKSRFRSHQHPTEKHLKGKTDPEPEFAQVEWLSVIKREAGGVKGTVCEIWCGKEAENREAIRNKTCLFDAKPSQRFYRTIFQFSSYACLQFNPVLLWSLLHCRLCVGVVFHVIVQVFQLRAEGSFSSDPALH